MVTNHGQTAGGRTFASDYFATFTTGSHPGGYKLTSVDFHFQSVAGKTLAWTAEVVEVDASGNPGTRLGNILTGPTPVNGTNTFTADGTGRDLAPNTTYGVGFDVTASVTAQIGVAPTTDEDSGALLGWSISDTMLSRDWNTFSWTTGTTTAGTTLRLAINGYAKDATTPTVDLVQVVSRPTHDSDSDGQFDTYVRRNEILFDVEISEPVVVAGGNANVRVRVDLGTDDTDLANSRKTAKLQSVLYGGRTLRFAYAVTASDMDPDGVWVQTGASDQVVFLVGTPTATVTSPLTGKDADLTKTGLPTEGGKLEGAVRAKVDGSVASSAGPTPTAAEVNDATLTVTFDEAISWTSDDDLSMNLSVQNTGDENGGNRNAYQHPIALAHGDTNSKLVLTLGYPAKASDTVTLSHYFAGGTPVLQDTSGNAADAFRDLAVTNNTPGAASAPVPVRAEVGGKELRIVFDSALDSGSAPAGSQFKVEWGNNNLQIGRYVGTGTATVSGRQVRVTLNKEVDADALAKVSYEKPTSNPLRASATGNPQVEAFDTFWIETVRDVKAPSLSRIDSVQTGTGPPTSSRILIYFDEPLDTSSKPAGGDFAVTVGSAAAVSPADSGVLITNTVVTLALSGTATMTAGTTQVKVVYTPGTNPLRDLAGNEAAAIDDTRVATSRSGKPSPLVLGVSGDGVSVIFSNKLWPGSIPDVSRFSLRYPHDTTLAYGISITAV